MARGARGFAGVGVLAGPVDGVELAQGPGVCAWCALLGVWENPEGRHGRLRDGARGESYYTKLDRSG